MAALGTPAKDLLPLPSQTPSGELLKTLTQLLANFEGDIDVTQPFSAVNATAGQNTTGLGVIEPPTDQNYAEWVPLIISIVDTAQIDPNDVIAMVYLDVPSGINALIYSSRGAAPTGINNTAWTWPVPNHFNTNTSTILTEWRPYRLFRKVGNDPFRRIRVDVATTATVGTRSFNCRVAYLRRPCTRV